MLCLVFCCTCSTQCKQCESFTKIYLGLLYLVGLCQPATHPIQAEQCHVQRVWIQPGGAGYLLPEGFDPVCVVCFDIQRGKSDSLSEVQDVASAEYNYGTHDHELVEGDIKVPKEQVVSQLQK